MLILRLWRIFVLRAEITEAMVQAAAKAAFLSHWPGDRWERFGPNNYVREQYVAIARAAIAEAAAAARRPVR